MSTLVLWSESELHQNSCWMPRLIVIQGPTASGKSALAVEIALHHGAPIISCDSRQFYREMSIGTAVPSTEELSAAKHYFVQDRSVEEPLSAGGFEKEALKLLEVLFLSHQTVVMVGGSGLYVDALIYGLDELPSSERVRAELNEIYKKDGIEPILEALKMADPVHYKLVDRANPMRVMRALEVCRVSGMPYSNLRTARQSVRNFDVVRLIVDMPRASLYERINLRVDQMVAQGLEHEARSVLKWRDTTALKTVGYSEFFDYFDGKISREECTEKIKQHTRNYAKRQLTWLARQSDIPRFAPNEKGAILNYIDGNI